ncbi:MAG TPA: alpha/beta fold hydrolase [Vicinamibacterales bacterium]|nr:alpha/beta fold hydrolase [Vicinamibacterales bacterium]
MLLTAVRAATVAVVMLLHIGVGIGGHAEGERAQEFRVASHDFVVNEFKFQSGETLPEVRIHYRTIGTPARDAAGRISNAMLVLHGSSGDSTQVLANSFTDPLIHAGQPLDARQHYLIFPDNLGNGHSTKPSDGLRARFPRYGYTDMVALQHRLITEHLGIARLRLVIGISMGGMQAWMWGVKYPQAMDAIVPIAAMPTAITGRNLLWRSILTQAIRNDPEWKNGDYTKQPAGFLAIMPMFDMLVQSPARLQESIVSRDRARAHLKDVLDETLEEDDANNILYRFESSFDYNVEPVLERIEARVLAILFADDELNPPELGTMERVMPRVKNGRLVLIPAGPQTEGHRTQVKAAVWREHLREFLKN